MSEPGGREVGVGVARDPRLGRRRLEPTEGHQEQEAATDFRVLFGSSSSSSEEEEEEEEVRDGDEVQRDDVRPVDRDAGPTSGPTLDAKGVALWEKGVLACPAERFGYAPAGIFPLDLKVGEREGERESHLGSIARSAVQLPLGAKWDEMCRRWTMRSIEGRGPDPAHHRLVSRFLPPPLSLSSLSSLSAEDPMVEEAADSGGGPPARSVHAPGLSGEARSL